MDAIREKIAKRINSGLTKPKYLDLVRELIDLNVKLANNTNRDPKSPDWNRYKKLVGFLGLKISGAV